MPAFADIANTVAARVEGCPHGFIIEALRDTTIDFCVRTRIMTAGHVMTLDGTETPTIDFDRQVVDIIDAKVAEPGDVLITYLNDPVADDDIETGCYVLRMAEPNAFDLLPAPTVLAPVTIELLLVIAPGPAASSVDDSVWLRHHEALRNGALARLFDESKKPWSDPAEGARRLGLYERAVTKTAAYEGRNRTQPGRRLRVKPV